MEASEALSEKILEERQIEKFSQFIEKYEVDVETLRSKLRPRKHAAATAAATADVEERVSLASLTGGLGAAPGVTPLLWNFPHFVFDGFPNIPLSSIYFVPILDSDNANISKVVLALAAVTEEVEQLTEAGSTRLLRPLLAFTDTEAGDTEARLAVARLCPHLQHLLNFADHCKDVLQNLLSQLSVLLGGKDKSPVKLSPGDRIILYSSRLKQKKSYPPTLK